MKYLPRDPQDLSQLSFHAAQVASSLGKDELSPWSHAGLLISLCRIRKIARDRSPETATRHASAKQGGAKLSRAKNSYIHALANTLPLYKNLFLPSRTIDKLIDLLCLFAVPTHVCILRTDIYYSYLIHYWLLTLISCKHFICIYFLHDFLFL